MAGSTRPDAVFASGVLPRVRHHSAIIASAVCCSSVCVASGRLSDIAGRKQSCWATMDANGTADQLDAPEVAPSDASLQSLPQDMLGLPSPISPETSPEQTPHLVVFSGGTAFNSIAGYMCKQFPRGMQPHRYDVSSCHIRSHQPACTVVLPCVHP